MNIRKMRGAGGLDVFLVGGVQVRGEGETLSTAYADIDGLYFEIARAVALRSGEMSAEEVRFLRKRIGMTQEELGALGGKKAQVAAKWEKGQLPMPRAEATLLRLRWLGEHAPKEVRPALKQLTASGPQSHAACFVFRFNGDRWVRELGTPVQETHDSAARDARVAIATARATETAYTQGAYA